MQGQRLTDDQRKVHRMLRIVLRTYGVRWYNATWRTSLHKLGLTVEKTRRLESELCTWFGLSFVYLSSLDRVCEVVDYLIRRGVRLTWSEVRRAEKECQV